MPGTDGEALGRKIKEEQSIKDTLLIKTAGIHYSIAQVCGYSSGLINSFLWNKLMTFKSRVSGKRTVIQGFQFLLVNGVSLGFTLLGLVLFVDYLQISLLIAKVFVIILAQLINFFCYRLIVFKDQKA